MKNLEIIIAITLIFFGVLILIPKFSIERISRIYLKSVFVVILFVLVPALIIYNGVSLDWKTNSILALILLWFLSGYIFTLIIMLGSVYALPVAVFMYIVGDGFVFGQHQFLYVIGFSIALTLWGYFNRKLSKKLYGSNWITLGSSEIVSRHKGSLLN